MTTIREVIMIITMESDSVKSFTGSSINAVNMRVIVENFSVLFKILEIKG